jgi:hypothetical protein
MYYWIPVVDGHVFTKQTHFVFLLTHSFQASLATGWEWKVCLTSSLAHKASCAIQVLTLFTVPARDT